MGVVVQEGWIPDSSGMMGGQVGDGGGGGFVGLWGVGIHFVLAVGFWVGDGRRWLDFDPVPIQAAFRCPGVGGHLPPAIAMHPRTRYGLARHTGREQSPSVLVLSKYGPRATYAGEFNRPDPAPCGSGSVGLPSKRLCHALPPERI